MRNIVKSNFADMPTLPQPRRRTDISPEPASLTIYFGMTEAKRSSVPSQVYDLFEQAIAGRKQILCTYDGYPRELCPHILGHTKGQEVALTFQFGGKSKSGLPPEGEWRCLWLSKVCDARLRDGPWHAGSSHSQPQPCVETVDVDVNPSSPYRPKRRS